MTLIAGPASKVTHWPASVPSLMASSTLFTTPRIASIMSRQIERIWLAPSAHAVAARTRPLSTALIAPVCSRHTRLYAVKASPSQCLATSLVSRPITIFSSRTLPAASR